MKTIVGKKILLGTVLLVFSLCVSAQNWDHIRHSGEYYYGVGHGKTREQIMEFMFGIQIGQEYNSSHYADKGYLFLLIDMTDEKAPVINVRTWQPNEVSMDKLFHAGDFYSE